MVLVFLIIASYKTTQKVLSKDATLILVYARKGSKSLTKVLPNALVNTPSVTVAITPDVPQATSATK